jgi:hypothetical protein
MIESYSVYVGKIFIMIGLALHVVFAALALVSVFVDIQRLNNMLDIIHIPILLGGIPYLVGLVFLIIGKCGDRKLKKFKENAKAIIPVKTLFLPGPSYAYGQWVDDRSFSSFRVECTIRSKKGREIVIKSRRLIIRKGLLQALPIYPHLDYEAVVYQNPARRHDFAVEILLPQNKI